MNLTELQVALRRFGFDDTDPLTTWLNAALHEFEDAYEWPFTEAETTDTLDAAEATLVLPADFQRIISIKIDAINDPLDYMDVKQFERNVSTRTTPGTPRVFTLVGLGTVRFWPVTGELRTVRLIYRKLLPDLVNPDDIPAIPIRYHYPLVLGAAAKGLQAENEEERAQTAQTEFDAAIARAIGNFANKQEMQPGQVQDVTSDYYG